MTLVEVRNRYELFIGLCVYFSQRNQVVLVVVGELALDVKVNNGLYGLKNIFYIPYMESSLYGKITYNLFGYKEAIRSIKRIDTLIVFHDSSPYVNELFGSSQIHLYEHGLVNYYSNINILKTYGAFSLATCLIKNGGKCCGRTKHVNTIFLKTPQSAPADIEHKVEYLDILGLWNLISGTSKYIIQELFECKQLDLGLFDGCNILVTQNLSEAGFISESEKLSIYASIIDKHHGIAIVIKPHPKEITKYECVFPQAVVLPSNTPVELLVLLGLKPKSVSTLFSSSALQFFENENVAFHWYGTSLSDTLYNKFGQIEMPYKSS